MRTTSFAGALALALVAGCGGKKDAGSASTSGSGSATNGGSSVGSGSGSAVTEEPVKVVPVTWTNPDGSPLLSLHDDGGIDGPCGPVGKLAGGKVVVGDKTLVWTGVDRKEAPDRKAARYQVAPLPWTIEVDEAGTVQLTSPGKPAVALGKATGTDSEDGKKLFAALVIAAPTLSIKLQLVPADGKPALALVGSADMDAWSIRQGDKVIAEKKRADPPVATAVFTEAADGTISAPKPIGKLVGRVKCPPHDKAVAALITAYVTR